MKENDTKPNALVAGLVAPLLLLGSSFAHGALVTIPASSLNSSPGVYTPDGYFTDTLGPNIVTTGGGNAPNIGGSNGRNDDGFMFLNLGFNVTYFGTTYSSLYINNNGNVSFGAGISEFIPSGPTGAAAPIISPFFADVDTRNPSSGVVHYDLGTDQLIVTWDQVGYFAEHADRRNSFQLVLRSDSFSVPTGEGVIGFFYRTMDWDDTDTNSVAAVGFGDGAGNGRVIAGSLDPDMNDVVENRYIWFDPQLDVVPPGPGTGVPEPGVLALLGLGLLGLRLRALR